MRRFLLALATLVFLDAFTTNCANPQPPTGGKKDTIPPLLIKSIPEDQKLNFKDQTITLTFDEYVSADKLKQNLIITPTTEVKYKIFPKKQTVILTFEESFEDSTTYTLNFFDGITDITERNPAENLILAFSTTSYIDSLYVMGKITDLMSGEPIEKMTVGLYRYTDTLDISKVKPTYFITTNEQGQFRIQNIKQNPYILMSFMDDNKNLLFDPAKESYAFLSDTIRLTESIEDSLYLTSININAAPLNFISARPSGRYFEARYSKPLIKYTPNFADTTRSLASDFTGEKESIRFYNNLNLEETDSLLLYLTVFDSLGNNSLDTIYVKFRESSRKPSEYKASLNPKSGTITQDTRYEIIFTKPSRKSHDSIFVYVPLDTLASIPLHPLKPNFNFNHTTYSFSLPPDLQTRIAKQLDSLKNAYYQSDSLNIDSTKQIVYKQLERINTTRFSLLIANESFISVEEDTLTELTANYSFAKPEDFGTVKISISTDVTSYTVQLMSNKNVVRKLTNCKTCTFQKVPPGNYWVRILIDENNDGKWSPGNFQNFIAPEPVIHFTEPTSLRANWQVELDYTF